LVVKDLVPSLAKPTSQTLNQPLNTRAIRLWTGIIAPDTNDVNTFFEKSGNFLQISYRHLFF